MTSEGATKKGVPSSFPQHSKKTTEDVPTEIYGRNWTIVHIKAPTREGGPVPLLKDSAPTRNDLSPSKRLD